jgi:hypothetical protein
MFIFVHLIYQTRLSDRIKTICILTGIKPLLHLQRLFDQLRGYYTLFKPICKQKKQKILQSVLNFLIFLGGPGSFAASFGGESIVDGYAYIDIDIFSLKATGVSPSFTVFMVLVMDNGSGFEDSAV